MKHLRTGYEKTTKYEQPRSYEGTNNTKKNRVMKKRNYEVRYRPLNRFKLTAEVFLLIASSRNMTYYKITPQGYSSYFCTLGEGSNQ